jgi:hypothetical protein
LELDGDVEEGTGLVLKATFLIFADDEAGLAAAAGPLREVLAGARWTEGPLVCGVRPDGRVSAAVAAAFAAAGRDFVEDSPPLPSPPISGISRSACHPPSSASGGPAAGAFTPMRAPGNSPAPMARRRRWASPAFWPPRRSG